MPGIILKKNQARRRDMRRYLAVVASEDPSELMLLC